LTSSSTISKSSRSASVNTRSNQRSYSSTDSKVPDTGPSPGTRTWTSGVQIEITAS